VQYMPGSKTSLSKGKFMPANRISTHVDHLGLLVNDRETAWKFYGDAFGFEKEGKDGSKMKVGDGGDRFELGVEKKSPTIDRFHVKDHICLSVNDVPKVSAMLLSKPEYEKFKNPKNENHQLGSGKNVQELYDLDGNRVELMEPPKGE
jgi:catechol 2,3-dioxygenase-like lactoylglutathione lyase family enzyme